MKTVQLLGVSLLAVFALSAIAARAAIAESEFLVGGTPAVPGEPGTLEGGSLLVNLNGDGVERKVLCSVVWEGEFRSTNDLLVAKYWDLTKQLGSLPNNLATECVNVLNCPEPLVWPDNLPWLAEVVLDPNGELLVLLTEGNGLGTFPGWEVQCMGEFGEPEALCEGDVEYLFKNGASDLELILTVAEMAEAKQEILCEDLFGHHVEIGALETEEALLTSSAGTTSVS